MFLSSILSSGFLFSSQDCILSSNIPANKKFALHNVFHVLTYRNQCYFLGDSEIIHCITLLEKL